MDPNNMNRFFNSSFFAQTPQKDNKQGGFGSNQQQPFGQPQPGFIGGQNAFAPPSGGMKSNFGATPSPFGGSFGGQPTGIGSSLQNQQPLTKFGSTGGFGTSHEYGSTPSTSGTLGGATPFGMSNPFGSLQGNVQQQGNVQPSGFGSGFQSSTQPFSTGLSASTTSGLPTTTQPSIWGQPSSTPASYNPFGSQNASGSSALENQNVSCGGLNRTFPSYGGSTGTRDHTYVQRKIREDNGGEVTLVHINGNENYSHKSIDELRSEDYSLGRKPVTAGSTTTPSGTSGIKPFQGFAPSSTGVPSVGIPTSMPGGTASMDTRAQSANIFGSTTPSTSFQPFVSTPSAPGIQQPSFTPGVASQQPFFPSVVPPATTPPVPAQPSVSNGSLFGLPPQQGQSTFGATGLFSQPSFGGLPTPQTQPFTQPMSPMTFPAQPTYPHQSKVDLLDPFLLKNIKFEKTEKEHLPLSKLFPQPIFRDEPKSQKTILSFRPPKSPVKEKIYTTPPLEEVRHMKEVHNLVIGFEDKGRIEYLDMVNGSEITMSNIQSKIYFSKESVVVNDPVGVGLNRRARVYVEGVFPYSRSLGDYIRGEQKQFPLKGIQERFVYGLKNDNVKRFVGYEYERGTYVYDVNHF